MTRARGRCFRGLRLIAPVPHGHWKTSTFVAGFRLDGITAPYVCDGAMNGAMFSNYVESMLAPTLSAGDVLVMDNVSTHKVSGIREAVEARNAQLLYLPPYSPDLNPIENAFAKLKSMLRSAGQRTIDGLWSFLGRALDAFPTNECLNYFRHCGYAATAA